MDRTLNDSIDFFRDVLIFSLEVKAPGYDMFISKNTKKDFPPYQWFAKNSN